MKVLVLVILAILIGCTSADPDKPASEAPPSFVRTLSFPNRLPRKVLALPDGAFAVLFDNFETLPDPLAPPKTFSALVRLEKDGTQKVLKQESHMLLLDVVADEAGNLILMDMHTEASLQVTLSVLSSKTGDVFSETTSAFPENTRFDRPEYGLTPAGRFYWQYHGHDVGALAYAPGVLHLSSRNRYGSVIQRTYQLAGTQLQGTEAVERMVFPGFTGITTLSYDGRVDIFSQKRNVYRTHLAIDDRGFSYIGAVGPGDAYLTEVEQLEKQKVRWLGDGPKDAAGFYVSRQRFIGGKRDVYFLPLESRIFQFGIEAMKIANGALWIAGYEREAGGENRFRGVVWRVALESLEKEKPEIRRYFTDAPSTASRVADLAFTPDAVYAVGARDFGYNPSGHSIGGPMNAFLQRRSVDGAQEIFSFVSSHRPDPLKDLLKQYRSVVVRGKEICSSGFYLPSTHAIDDDYRKFKAEGFLECIDENHRPPVKAPK